MISSPLSSPRVSIYNMLIYSWKLNFQICPVIEHHTAMVRPSAPGGGGCYYPLSLLCRGSSRNVETASGQTVNNAISEPRERTRTLQGAGIRPAQSGVSPNTSSLLQQPWREKRGTENKLGFQRFWSDKPLSPFTLVLILFSCCS